MDQYQPKFRHIFLNSFHQSLPPFELARTGGRGKQGQIFKEQAQEQKRVRSMGEVSPLQFLRKELRGSGVPRFGGAPEVTLAGP